LTPSPNFFVLHGTFRLRVLLPRFFFYRPTFFFLQPPPKLSYLAFDCTVSGAVPPHVFFQLRFLPPRGPLCPNPVAALLLHPPLSRQPRHHRLPLYLVPTPPFFFSPLFDHSAPVRSRCAGPCASMSVFFAAESPAICAVHSCFPSSPFLSFLDSVNLHRYRPRPRHHTRSSHVSPLPPLPSIAAPPTPRVLHLVIATSQFFFPLPLFPPPSFSNTLATWAPCSCCIFFHLIFTALSHAVRVAHGPFSPPLFFFSTFTNHSSACFARLA